VSGLLLQAFDRLAQAPGGVARLRELILSLAVRGKLVPQLPCDQSAQELTERLDALRSSRVRKAPSPSNRPDVFVYDQATLPCELPTGWVWVSLTDLGEFCGGKTPSKQNASYWSGSIPWITPKDMKQLRLADSEDHVSHAALEDGLVLIPRNSLLIVVRSGILRRTVPTAINEVETTINQDLKALKLSAPELASYLQLLVRGFERFILDNLTKVGTTVESIRFEDFASQPFPLPPLSEQSRIVTRVDELMRLCDVLEAKGRLEAEQHTRLLDTLLGTLTDSTTPEELAANWQRVAEHFDLLLDRPEAVDALEQTILQLAVRGLLVPQDPSDEPADTLLMQIREHKARLVNAGKVRVARPVDEIDVDELPFNLPQTWAWARFGDITINRDGERVPVSSSDREQRTKVYDYYGASGVIDKIDGYLFDKTLLLIGEDGANLLNRSTPIAFLAHGKYWVNNHAHVIDTIDVRLMLYLELFVNAISLEPYVTGTAQPKMNQAKLNSIVVALPPLAEQSRIVARVTDLRRLCADLRQRLAASQATQSRLAEALVESVASA
jgi:type I restriction enzyme S subunit